MNLKFQKTLRYLVLAFIAIQPLVDMDYLFYDFLDSMGLPRLSTVLRFVVLPLLVLLVFWTCDKKKKKTFFITALYGIAVLVYYYLHSKQAVMLFDRLDFTDNFYFSYFQELTYILTLVLPYAIIYMAYQEDITMKELKWITILESALISITIVFGDLYVCARSTYYGNTVGNVFSWFTNIYEWYHPRTLASKFFFNEGNTIGILLFMLLPVLYYFLFRSEKKKEQNWLLGLIFLHSLAMQMLATRVATYGALLVPIVFLCIYYFDCIKNKKEIHKIELIPSIFAILIVGGLILIQRLKNQAILDTLVWVLLVLALLVMMAWLLIQAMNKSTNYTKRILFTVFFAILFSGILDRTPAIQNQKVDAKNDVALLHNGMADLGREELKNAEDLIPGSPEYINFYVYMFETYGINARYIQSVPSMYYTEYYSYQHDPKFWTDVCFMDVFDRVSGRQIETIFFNYKYKSLTPQEKILGMGYSPFMNGSIVLEQDFKQQVYTLGYLGFVLCVAPWLLVVIYGVYKILRHYKRFLNMEIMVLAFALASGLGSAWLSGHVLDQFVTSTYMALLTAILLRKVNAE
ncbi:MAG: O-antigen ligase family protein [Solobacterium sp.]|nr:O-antigen ligase family protein [Solobacterium sp.]